MDRRTFQDLLVASKTDEFARRVLEDFMEENSMKPELFSHETIADRPRKTAQELMVSKWSNEFMEGDDGLYLPKTADGKFMNMIMWADRRDGFLTRVRSLPLVPRTCSGCGSLHALCVCMD